MWMNLENMLLSERSQSQDHVLYEMSGIDKATDHVERGHQESGAW